MTDRENGKQRSWTICSVLFLLSGGILASDFFLTEFSQLHMGLALLIFVLSLIAVLVSMYSIAFTNLRNTLMGIAAIAVVISVWVNHAPAKLRFQFAQAEFRKVASTLRNGGRSETPFWIGSYRISEVKWDRSGEVRFWTSVHPTGNTGIVQRLGKNPSRNVSREVQLADRWFIVSQD